MKMNSFIPIRWLAGALAGVAYVAFGITPAQVQQRLEAGGKITFVDVRDSVLFERGHLPGALNIPAQLVPEKQLPPIGEVVVYDGGLGAEEAYGGGGGPGRSKVRRDITAEVLDGGYAAWEMAAAATTKLPGLHPESIPLITYAQLQKLQSADTVLVDLRQSAPTATEAPVTKATTKIAPMPLTDLAAEFPKARVVQSPFSGVTPQAKAKAANATPPLLVLIDDGDGRARDMARALKANGVTRFVILAGGEQILAVHGQAGLQRIGSSVNVRHASGVSAAAAP